MRQQQNRHMSNKNRGNQHRKTQNPLSRTYESNGPGVKVRGNAQTVYDKYISLARDAHSCGDNIAAENFYQHAEHYKRIIIEATPVQQPQSNSSAQQEKDSEMETQIHQENSSKKENAKDASKEKQTSNKNRIKRNYVKVEENSTSQESTSAEVEVKKTPKRRSPRKIAEAKSENNDHSEGETAE